MISKKDRVITQVDFNQFLAKIIKEHGILTANGRKAVVTSHALRHVCIGERLRSGIYSPEHTMKEANHSNVDVTLSYDHKNIFGRRTWFVQAGYERRLH